jgi:hypothetical protein
VSFNRCPAVTLPPAASGSRGLAADDRARRLCVATLPAVRRADGDTAELIERGTCPTLDWRGARYDTAAPIAPPTTNAARAAGIANRRRDNRLVRYHRGSSYRIPETGFPRRQAPKRAAAGSERPLVPRGAVRARSNRRSLQRHAGGGDELGSVLEHQFAGLVAGRAADDALGCLGVRGDGAVCAWGEERAPLVLGVALEQSTAQ